MSTTDDKIDLLYPDSPKEDTPPKETTSKDTLENGYKPEPDKTKGNPYSLDKGSLEDNLYGSESKIVLSEETDLSIIYASEEDQAALRENLGYMANEVGASQADIHEMVSHANKEIVAGRKHSVDESLNLLFEEHGSCLKGKLADAQALVNSMPDLAAWLDETQLGNDPTMINKIIRIAQTPRAKARLAKLRSR